MTTEYTLRLTVCTPIDSIDDANQLALAAGESERDVNTFVNATHIKDGQEYACISTVIKPIVAGWAQSATMPDKPWPYDKQAAARALQSCVIDIRARPANAADILEELGFEAIVEEDDDQ